MKKLTWSLVIPLTIISFYIFTKWWYILPVDAPDSIFYGFPFPFIGDGWFTSGSLQIFIFELVSDLLIYFIIWFTIIYCCKKYLRLKNIPKLLTATLLSLMTLIITYAIWVASYETVFLYKRDFDMEIMETGFKFIWQDQTRPDFNNYHPQKSKE
jgi:hypothetical protein